MDTDLIIPIAPAERDLKRRRAELDRLERELAERAIALAAFKSELAAFEARYFRAFGDAYAELDELEARSAEAAARLRPEDGTKRRKAERARARANQSADSGTIDRPQPRPTPIKPGEDLKKLYRALTKLAHPDLAPDADERVQREAVMVLANAAYAEGNGEMLAFLLEDRELDQAALNGHAADALVRVERQIARILERLEQPAVEQAAAENSDLGRLMRRSAMAEEQGRELFAKIAEELDEQKRHVCKRIKTLERRLAKGNRDDARGDRGEGEERGSF